MFPGVVRFIVYDRRQVMCSDTLSLPNMSTLHRSCRLEKTGKSFIAEIRIWPVFLIQQQQQQQQVLRDSKYPMSVTKREKVLEARKKKPSN